MLYIQMVSERIRQSIVRDWLAQNRTKIIWNLCIRIFVGTIPIYWPILNEKCQIANCKAALHPSNNCNKQSQWALMEMVELGWQRAQWPFIQRIWRAFLMNWKVYGTGKGTWNCAWTKWQSNWDGIGLLINIFWENEMK